MIINRPLNKYLKTLINKPIKSQAKEFKKQMEEIREFCNKNNIQHSHSMDSYYFTINNKHYRVSNHSVESSNAKAFNDYGEQLRQVYHANGRELDTQYIHASKTRLKEIYNNLKQGYTLDNRGNIKNV